MHGQNHAWTTGKQYAPETSLKLGGIKIVNSGTLEIIAVIILKFEQGSFRIQQYILKMQIEWQTV